MCCSFHTTMVPVLSSPALRSMLATAPHGGRGSALSPSSAPPLTQGLPAGRRRGSLSTGGHGSSGPSPARQEGGGLDNIGWNAGPGTAPRPRLSSRRCPAASQTGSACRSNRQRLPTSMEVVDRRAWCVATLPSQLPSKHTPAAGRWCSSPPLPPSLPRLTMTGVMTLSCSAVSCVPPDTRTRRHTRGSCRNCGSGQARSMSSMKSRLQAGSARSCGVQREP